MGEYDARSGEHPSGLGALKINGSGPAVNRLNGSNGSNGSNGMDGMSTHPADDPRSPLEAERARLEGEIAALDARKAAAERRAADVTGAMHAVVMRSKEQLAEIELTHNRTIEAIRAQARDEVERIIADAQRQVGQIDPSASHPTGGTHQGFA